MTDRHYLAPAILKTAYAVTRADALSGKAREVELAKAEGMAVVAADVLHFAMTPHGFLLAVREAVREVGALAVPTAATRDRAQELRATWERAIVRAVSASDMLTGLNG